MAAGELEFVIKARDELSKTLTSLDGVIQQFGASAKGEFDKVGRSVSGVTAFVREQVKENRLQNFLFREGAQTIGALSLGLSLFAQSSGGADNNTKKLSRTLNEAFLSFQGINFALAAFGPYVSLAGGAIAGLAVGFTRWADTTEETMTRVEGRVKIFVDRLRGANEDQLRDALNEIRLESARIDAEILTVKKGEVKQKKRPPVGLRLTKLEDDKEVVVDEKRLTALRERSLVLLGEMEVISKALPSSYDVLNKKTKEGVEQEKRRAENLSKYHELVDAINKEQLTGGRAVNAVVAAGFPLQASITRTASDRLTLYNLLGEQQFIEYVNAERRLKVAQETNRELSRVAETRPSSFDQKFKGFDIETLTSLEGQFETLGVTADSTAGLIASSMQDAARLMVDAMFGATTSIGEFFLTMLRSISQLLVEELLKIGVRSFITGVLGIPGFGGGTTPGRIPDEIESSSTPSGSRTVNVFVNGEKLYASPAERQITGRRIADLIYTEKFA